MILFYTLGQTLENIFLILKHNYQETNQAPKLNIDVDL